MGSWRRIRLSIALFGIITGGCPSPSGPPSPPAEIPALVAFPRTVGIDVSKAGGGGSTTAALKAQTALEDFSDIISLGPLTFAGFNFLLDTFLDPLSDLEIPVSPTVTTFDGPMTFGPGIVAQVKIDFSDFDLDGDGASEGCTGCTCPTGCAPTISECPREASAWAWNHPQRRTGREHLSPLASCTTTKTSPIFPRKIRNFSLKTGRSTERAI